MNTLIKHIENWHNSLTDTTKYAIDLLVHYIIAYSIILNLGALTYYLGNICKELFFYTALLALLMIPIRILSVHFITIYKRDKYIKQVLNEILNDDSAANQSYNNNTDDDDEDDWFMKIARG
jgi:TM2 domain-containing membrane protein YozV